MAKSRIKPMQLVLQMAEQAEKKAAERVTEQIRLLQNEEKQLQDLQSYSEQYLDVYGGRRQGVSAQEMMNYSGFISRLADVIKEQQIKLQTIQKGLDKLKSQWSYARQKRKVLEDLIERLKKEQTAELEKQLQKELDELANRPNGLC